MKRIVAAIALTLAGVGPAVNQGFTTSFVFAANYGVIASSNPADAAANESGLLSAVSDCSHLSGGTAGCILQMPCGRIQRSGQIDIIFGLKIQGCGAGQNRVYDPDVPIPIDVGGTVFVQICLTCYTFSFTTTNSVQVTDIGIDMPLNATAGGGIRIRAAVSVPDTVRVRNWHSIISNLDLVGGFNQIVLENANAYTIRDNSFRSAANDGVLATNPATAPTYEAGDAQIYGNKFWLLLDHLGPNIFPFRGNCITLQPQSGVQIFGGKMLGCKTGIKIVAAPSGGGNVHIFGLNMEEMGLYGIHLSQGLGSAGFGGLKVTNVHIAGIASGTFAIGIYIAAGTFGYNQENIITDSYFSVGNGIGNAHCIYLADGISNKVSGNRCRIDSSGGNQPGGITVTGNATDTELLDNTITGTAAPARRYTLNTPTLVRDLTGMTVADFAYNFAKAKGGSTILFTDGRASSWPTNPALTNLGAGCVATANSAGIFMCPQP